VLRYRHIYGIKVHNLFMKKIAETFKKYFIPHEGNDHRPYILRREIIVFACLVALAGEFVFVVGTSFLVPRSRLFGIILVSSLTDETNSQRTADDLSALRVSPLLEAAAQEKANDMAAKGYFAHVSPDGTTPWQWFENVGYDFSAAGENLAVNFSDSEDVTTAWMNSPEHRANILNGTFTEIGIATANGTYNGSPAVFVVELFGTPATVPVAAIPAATFASAPPKTATVKLMPTSATTTAVSKTITENAVQTFAAVAGAATGTVPAAVSATAPIAASAVPAAAVLKMVNEANPVQAVAANPRQAINYFYLMLMSVFGAALLFNIFIKIRIQYPNLIMGGVAVVAIAGVCIILNQQLLAGFVL
jgi:hypothetical protein